MIIIIGAAEEFHSKWIYDNLVEQGHQVAYFNTQAFPHFNKVSLMPHQPLASGYFTPYGEEKTALSDVQSVYFRYQMGFAVHPDIPADFRGVAAKEIQSAIGGFYRLIPNAKWVNPYQSIEGHVYKVHQLKLMAEAGISIPKTLITNDPDAVVDFYKACNRQVIYKPVAGGAHTQHLTQEDLTQERLAELSKSPVQFQERIDGVDVRVYAMGQGETFAAEIQAKTLDFRDDKEAPIVPVELPEEVQAQCHMVKEVLGYQYSGVDVRKTPDGRYVFIEGNPCPMFYYFEQQTGYPITSRLIALLTS